MEFVNNESEEYGPSWALHLLLLLETSLLRILVICKTIKNLTS
jgi:hypothetical protein